MLFYLFYLSHVPTRRQLQLVPKIESGKILEADWPPMLPNGTTIATLLLYLLSIQTLLVTFFQNKLIATKPKTLSSLIRN